jgi:uncharacterized protein YbjT (DUF2867 family)
LNFAVKIIVTKKIINMSQNLRILLTGATGMVGEGVLHECVLDPNIAEIVVLGRKPCGYSHPKITDLITPDLMNLSKIKSQLVGFDACMFCSGVSSVGISQETFYTMTYTMTMSIATVLQRQNPNMVFCYITGAGTDSTEKGKIAWARTKGKTENDLMKLPFKAVYNFRPGALMPTQGLKNQKSYYKYLGWLGPIFKWIAPNSISTLAQLGKAMIRVCTHGYHKSILEVKDILILG